MQLFSNKKILSKKGGFTLVEMLIVIVIIGILAAALIPRLNTARGRANDTARKADLQQVSAVMVSYNIDHGVFPGDTDLSYNLEEIRIDLESAGISTVPLDPNRSRTFNGIGHSTSCNTTDPGQYGYVAIRKNGISRGGFVLMAGTETIGGSNTVYDINYGDDGYTVGCIQYDAAYSDVILCNEITHTTSTDLVPLPGPCLAEKDTDVLRYIYIY